MQSGGALGIEGKGCNPSRPFADGQTVVGLCASAGRCSELRRRAVGRGCGSFYEGGVWLVSARRCFGTGEGGRGMPPSSHMQPRSSTRMPPPPAGRGLPNDKPLLHVGPWQEYALSALLARMRAQTVDEVLRAMATAAAGGSLPGLATPVSGAVSPVDSYVGSMSSARSERSAQSTKSASSTRTSRTDPSSWASSSTASANAALFRRARNLKYKGPTYDKPWQSRLPRRKTTKEIELERRRHMYALGGDTGHSNADAPAMDEPQDAQMPPLPLHGRRAPHARIPGLQPLQSSPAAHRANALAQSGAARTVHQGTQHHDEQPEQQLYLQRQQREQMLTKSSTPRDRDSLDDHLASLPTPQASPLSLPRTPGTPRGDDEADDLLKWADGIDLANISQEWG